MLLAFDLDGVLVDTPEMHYEALNDALAEVSGPQYVITRDEHLALYDGLPSMTKLERLVETRGLPRSDVWGVWEQKQAFVNQMLDELPRDDRLCDLFKRFKKGKHTIVVTSNAIRPTVQRALARLGLLEFVDRFYGNEDVRRPKPHPEMYLRAMADTGYGPGETVIVEDSQVGRQAAHASGARVVTVEHSGEVTYERVVSDRPQPAPKWKTDCQVLIPMAGAGSRFEQAGYTFPKPLVDVAGKPMIQVVVENLNLDADYTFLVRKEHLHAYALEALLNLLAPGCTIIPVDGLTDGAACTALLAREVLDPARPLLIANSDQFIGWDSAAFMWAMRDCDGGIPTFTSTHPKWSFVETKNGLVTRVAEKEPISDQATCGVYYWKHAEDFFDSADEMIEEDDRTNGEFYIAPTYNWAVLAGARIRTWPVEEMWGLGTPEDLNEFLRR